VVLCTEIAAGQGFGWEYVKWSGKVWQTFRLLSCLAGDYMSLTVNAASRQVDHTILNNLVIDELSAVPAILLPWCAGRFVSLPSQPRHAGHFGCSPLAADYSSN